MGTVCYGLRVRKLPHYYIIMEVFEHHSGRTVHGIILHCSWHSVVPSSASLARSIY